MVLVSSDTVEDRPGRVERDERWARLDCTRPGHLVSSQRHPMATMTTDDSDDSGGRDDGESRDDDVSVSYDGDDREGGEDERGGHAGPSR